MAGDLFVDGLKLLDSVVDGWRYYEWYWGIGILDISDQVIGCSDVFVSGKGSFYFFVSLKIFHSIGYAFYFF